MVNSLTTSVIVALKGVKNLETDGYIIQIGNGASVNTVRGLAAEKLDLALPLADIILETSTEEILTEIDAVRAQKVIYVTFEERIKDVPGPTRYPLVGNLYDMMPDMTAGFRKQFDRYGPLVNVNILGTELVATNHPIYAELFAKESEWFTKQVGGALIEIKNFSGNGLFTSNSDDFEWKLAHKLLMPAFSPRAIKAYQPEMGKITEQTMNNIFAHYKPDEKVDILHWMTAVTFETIGRIGFGYSFDMLQRIDEPSHPFIDAMSFSLGESAARFFKASFVKKLPTETNNNYKKNNDLMKTIVEQVIKERKEGPDANDIQKDLLGFMLNARDEHSLGLSDQNIRDQVITFLIAGHDTTANTLAWTLYHLALDPEIEAKVLQEIANVGISSNEYPTPEQISSLKYMHRVLKEVLRLYPPVRVLGKYCKKDCVVPGGYSIKAGNTCMISAYNMHRNPDVYPNPTKFDPERWTPEEEQKRSRYAWLPFSTGPRSCIGMAFALQEAKTVLAMILHRFKFCYDGPAISYDPKQPTTKPDGLFVTIHPRTDFPEPSADFDFQASSKNADEPEFDLENITATTSVDLPKITFLFGTQTGSAQDYANQLSIQAKRFGFKDIKLCSMDQWELLEAGKKTDPKEKELVIICTATYNGFPPDSAEAFDKFLDRATTDDAKILGGVQYAVFGLGNKNWRTYQAFPNKVDKYLEELGAERIFPPGSGDADKDIDGDFNRWCYYFWQSLSCVLKLDPIPGASIIPTAAVDNDSFAQVSVKFIPPTDSEKWKLANENKNGEYNAKVLTNRELQTETSDRSTRHIEIDVSKLDSIGETHLYDAGDHLEIMPENKLSDAEAIALGFGLILDSVFEIDPESIEGVSPRSLAASIKGPCTVRNTLVYYADILSPPSRRMLGKFAEQLRSVAPETADIFDKLTMPDENNVDQYPTFIEKHRTLLDLQRAFPQVNRLDLGQFLATVGVMQPRRYSIASSPLAHPTVAHITVGVVDDVIEGRHYPGLASSYLLRLKDEGNTLRAKFKSSKSTFSLPQNIEAPLVMVAAGTGVSPFRGFLQERAYQREQGQKVGPCILFFGCRHPEQDYIYREELDKYVQSGLLQSYTAFSRLVPTPARKYVQHQLLANAADVWNVVAESKGVVYVCGAGAMSQEVRSTFETMTKSFGVAQSDEEARDYIGQLLDNSLYREDVWG